MNCAKITGLGTNPAPKNFNSAMAAGYAIVDRQNMLLLYTVSSNRSEAWKKFCSASRREQWKSVGFKSVPVMVKEYER